MEKNVLILSDFVGYGNVAMATARGILTRMGYGVFCLPTAVISNTWNYGATVTLDTTDYLRLALENWSNLGFRIDAVQIGYLANGKQATWTAEQCRKWKAAGVSIFLDPIFADNGKLYNGVTEQQVDLMRQLLTSADYAMPNPTEARFLARLTAETEELTMGELTQISAALSVPNLLLTGALVEGETAVILRDNTFHILPYEVVPGNFSGTGDIFSALFLGFVLAGKTAQEAAEAAIAQTKEWILRTFDDDWHGTGLPVERYF